jgi:hypothetical protein
MLRTGEPRIVTDKPASVEKVSDEGGDGSLDINSNNKIKNNSDKIVAQYRALLGRCTHLQYAINSSDGPPELAVTPFLMQQMCLEGSGPEKGVPSFGLFVLGSMLSSASRALRAVAESATVDDGQPLVSVMCLDEINAEGDPYAQTRLTLSARVEMVPRDTPAWHNAVSGLSQRHGETVNLLVSLQDFYCFAFYPVSGLFVKGFGKAFRLTGEDLTDWTHLRES